MLLVLHSHLYYASLLLCALSRQAQQMQSPDCIPPLIFAATDRAVSATALSVPHIGRRSGQPKARCGQHEISPQKGKKKEGSLLLMEKGSRKLRMAGSKHSSTVPTG